MTSNQVSYLTSRLRGGQVSKTMENLLFGCSLFPYLLFLGFATKSKQFPPIALWGFYGTLVFVAITIPVGIYALKVYHTSLANVDWLHGSAEAFLTLANILVVLGFKRAVGLIENESDSNVSG